MSLRHLQEALVSARMDRGLDTPKFRFSAVDTGRSVPPPAPFDEGVYSLQFSPDGGRVAAGSASGAVRLLHCLDPHADSEPLPSKLRFGLAITCLRFQPGQQEARLFAASASGEVFALQAGRAETAIVEEGNEINSIDFSPDAAFLATGGKDANVRIYAGDSLHALSVLSGYSAMDYRVLDGHTMRLFALRFSPDNSNLLFTAGWDNDVKLWDVRVGGSAVGRIKGPHVCGDGLDMLGATLMTASWSCAKALQLWDIRQLGLLASLPCSPDGGPEFLYAGRFADKASVVVGGSGFNGLAAVSVPTGEIYGKVDMPGPVFAIASTFGGRTLAVGSSDGTVKLATMR